MNSPPPSPAEQVRFLHNLQRILAEDSFVASYKFALLHGLADLAALDAALDAILEGRRAREDWKPCIGRNIKWKPGS